MLSGIKVKINTMLVEAGDIYEVWLKCGKFMQCVGFGTREAMDEKKLRVEKLLKDSMTWQWSLKSLDDIAGIARGV